MKREQWNNQLNLTTEAKWENQCVNKNNSGQKTKTNENIDLYTAYYVRVNSRFQFQVTHSKLCAILATDEINFKSYSVLTYTFHSQTVKP